MWGMEKWGDEGIHTVARGVLSAKERPMSKSRPAPVPRCPLQSCIRRLQIQIPARARPGPALVGRASTRAAGALDLPGSRVRSPHQPGFPNPSPSTRAALLKFWAMRTFTSSPATFKAQRSASVCKPPRSLAPMSSPVYVLGGFRFRSRFRCRRRRWRRRRGGRVRVRLQQTLLHI